METLDSTVSQGTPNASYWPYVIRFGVIIGIIGAVITLLMYVGGNGLDFLPWILSIVGIALISIILNGILATRGVRAYRETELGGLIPFGKAFVVAFLILLVSSLISGVFNVLYITLVDPDFAQGIAAKMADFMNEAGVDELEVEKQIAQLKTNFSLNRQLVNLATAPLGAAFIGLIAAAAAKRNPPVE